VAIFVMVGGGTQQPPRMCRLSWMAEQTSWRGQTWTQAGKQYHPSEMRRA